MNKIKVEIFEKPSDMLKISLPGALFTVQNNLTFLALSFMDAASFQVMSQLKILTTAIMSIIMLQRKLDQFKWISLFLLMIGVSMIEVKFFAFFLSSFKNKTCSRVAFRFKKVALLHLCRKFTSTRL